MLSVGESKKIIMESTIQPPLPGKILQKNLILSDSDDSFDRIFQGIELCVQNAKRLISDVKLLVDNNNYSSALFLLTTAREEFAKSYLLFDLCRLDFTKHHSVLGKLCRAFYDHVKKHAYLEVIEFPNINSMEDAKRIWDLSVQKYWPATSEYEPDLPHETCFTREFPLYVDFIDYDQNWSIPRNTGHECYFEEIEGWSMISRMEKHITIWENDISVGFLGPALLKSMNSAFKNCYITENSDNNEIRRLYQVVIDHFLKANSFTEEYIKSSSVFYMKWPLYHFVASA